MTSTEPQGGGDAERVLQDAARTAQANAAAGPSRLGDDSPLMQKFHRAMRSVQIITPEEQQRKESEQAQRAAVQRVAVAHRRSNVPPKYATARLGEFAGLPGDSLAAYRTAARQMRVILARPGVYALTGEIGAGKTRMASALVNEFCDAGRSARIVKTGDYIRDYRATWKAATAGAEARYEAEHVGFSLLVLDEWQIRKDTDDENLLLVKLINLRYEADRATVIVGNHLTQEEFEKGIDARIASRIADGGGYILANWPDLRGRCG